MQTCNQVADLMLTEVQNGTRLTVRQNIVQQRGS